MRLSARLAIEACIVWMFLVVTLLTIGTFTNPMPETPVARAMMDMIWGLVLIWVVGGGLLMLLSRDKVKKVVARIHLDRRLVFFLFAVGLSLAEEAVTVGMTNLAPVFGVGLDRRTLPPHRTISPRSCFTV
jgi:nitrogen fixation/metabolism regulation signal transduction histidine kinase